MGKNAKGWALMLIVLLLVGGGGLWLWRTGKAKHPVHPKSPVVRQPVKDKVSLTIYYPNQKYIESGDESLPKFLPKKVTVVDRTVSSAIAELQKAPADLEMAPVIRKGLKILDTRVEKGIAYVNFSGTNLYGGSLEEMIIIQSVVRTLTGVQGVQKVQFLVDGEVRETLMGHIETTDPIGVNDL
ncbi:MAG TPA: GerMN domain-containing protein [Bacillota bacterium]|nr:GerMN domain-containing protein [Bacillota bacterium]